MTASVLSNPADLSRDVKGGGGFEQYCRIVAPLRWREVSILMLTACFDAGGKDSHEHNVLSVAGFAGFSGMWDEFNPKWNRRLEQDSLPYFHPGEFAHSTGAFAHGWKNNEDRRRTLSGDLMDIIYKCGLRKFGHVIRIEDYKGVLAKHNLTRPIPAWPVLNDAFVICAMKCIENFYAYAKGEGVTSNIRYVFDKGDPEDALRLICRGHKLQQPDFQWSRPVVDSKGIAHDPFIGLQAAGWIAYEYYLDANRLLFGQPSDRWALQEFESMPGHVIVLHHKELLPDLPSLRNLMQTKTEAVRDATLWLDLITRPKEELEKLSGMPEFIESPGAFGNFRYALKEALSDPSAAAPASQHSERKKKSRKHRKLERRADRSTKH